MLEPSGLKSRPAKVGHHAGSESCVASGRPSLRSVDSEREGRVIEPRNEPTQEPKPLRRWKATPTSRRVGQRPNGLCSWVRRGRRARHAREGSPGTWEILSSPPMAVAPSEGNEATRDGRQEVRAARSSDEAGEPTRGTQWSEGAAGLRNRTRERWRRRQAPGTSQRNSIG